MATPDDLPETHARLAEVFGTHVWAPDLDPLSELIGTILSQHTTGANSRRAFDALRQRFPTWEAMLDAAPNEIADAIRSAGLARLKAPRIKRILAQIHGERGAFDLRFLRDLTVGEAMAWLKRLPGVGQNTAACVLLFGLGRPAMPVDGGIHRVAARLGLVVAEASPEAVQDVLVGATRPEWVYTLHLNLITFSRQICRPAQPRCEICPLNDLCDYFRAARAGGRRWPA